MPTRKARILAIDEQLYFRSFVEGLLGEEGYEVHTASGGPDALEMLGRDGPFDVAVMDLALPDSDGISMIGRLRERCETLRVIITSSVGDVRSVAAA
ncbi:unnamed protein product, partial [marine sediment metagenome]